MPLFYRFDKVWPAMRLILFQRDDCPLCDQALALLAAARVPDFETRWIDDDTALEARYGARVPVLRDDGADREIAWPFDVEALRAFVAAAQTHSRR
jgi:glutaredoxin